MHEFSKKFFPTISGVLSLALLCLGIGVLRQDGYVGSTFVPVVCGAAMCGVAAIFVWLGLRGCQLVALLCGVILCFFAACVMYLGAMLGAPAIPILIVPVLLFVAVVAFFVPPTNASAAEPPNNSLERTRGR